MNAKNAIRTYTLHNYREIPQIARLSAEDIEAIEVVGRVLPFKTNNYVVDELIDWDNVPEDPIFTLNFPRRGMLEKKYYRQVKRMLDEGWPADRMKQAIDEIRLRLNPNPAGQEHNVPMLGDIKLKGIQHKYRETLLFFPSQGQTCHAYCTFCFRWPQFSGMSGYKFAMKETDLLLKYLRLHRGVTDVLFTGGDPMTMSAHILEGYIAPLLTPEFDHVRTIRIGTKSLAYWPYRFVTDADADDVLRLFERIVAAGKNLAIQAHFNHPAELSTDAVREAIGRIRATGAQIRTQSPLLRHINDHSRVWAEMWRRQTDLGCIPYYCFVARDTGAKHFFELPLVRCWDIFRRAYRQVSGICRTVRGPSMSHTPGKVQLLGVAEVRGEKVFVLRFLQGRNPKWVDIPFFARYDPEATWLDQLVPAFGEEQFFFERDREFSRAMKDSQRDLFE
ncbi:lysine 2,3-aminomutase [Alistipes sp. OttesenSCG-928-B03]|nr:lysine 2,3-aminomutase [Alistipes sp. OttesenSCG-928-B03]